MRPELIEIEHIDQYILKQLSAEDKLVFEARMILNDHLAKAVATQRKTHQLLRLFWRSQQRARLEQVYKNLLQDKTFSNRLKALFS